jgi:hypothetical protein
LDSEFGAKKLPARHARVLNLVLHFAATLLYRHNRQNRQKRSAEEHRLAEEREHELRAGTERVQAEKTKTQDPIIRIEHTKPVLLALHRAVWLAIGSRIPQRKIVRLTPVSPATWLMLVWGLLGVVTMHASAA